MAADTHETRKAWVRHRTPLRLAEETPDEEFGLGGLAQISGPLDIRIVILPADVANTSTVPLDAETDEWISGEHPSPYAGRPVQWGHTSYATSHALARATWYRDDQLWTRYLAIHRHGGIEIGIAGVAWTPRDDVKVFPLRHPVAALWIALALQIDAADRWLTDGPWEITLALVGTKGALLSDFGEGWTQFGDFRYDAQPCRETRILHRWEIDQIDPQAIALDAGARVENSFGSTRQRHIARRGEYDGEFDPRIGW